MSEDHAQLAGWLKHWEDVTRAGYSFTDPDRLQGVLNDARWDDERLDELFAPLPHRAELLERVRECVGCQAPEDHRPYVIPAPSDATDDELIALTREALDRIEACGVTPEDRPIHVWRRALAAGERGRVAPLSEQLGDEFIAQGNLEHRFLSEAVYGLTAHIPVRNYILTPCSRSGVIREVDPYQPQFELWKRSAQALVTWGSLGNGIAVFVG